MSTAHPNESDFSFTKSLLKQMAKDLHSFQPRKQQHKNQIIEEKCKRDSHLVVIEEKIKIIREKYEIIIEKLKSQKS